jgi:hypothetical protein
LTGVIPEKESLSELEPKSNRLDVRTLTLTTTTTTTTTRKNGI